MNAKLRAWWWSRQGLDGSLMGKSPMEALVRSGWARSVGGANPYITIFSRTGASRAEIDKAVADAEIHELPSARRCTYVLPKEHYGLGLTIAQGPGESSDMTADQRVLGVSVAEIDALCDAVVAALQSNPLDPAEIKKVVGDAARSLGEEGKKRGVSNTIPIALGRLQVEGRIRRVPVDARLDRQRYKYAAWAPSPRDSYKKSYSEALTELAKLYWQWAGPASLAHFQWFSGLGVKASKEVVDPLGFVPAEPGSDLLLAPADLEAFNSFIIPSEPAYSLVASLDATLLLKREVKSLVAEEDLTRNTATDKALQPLGAVQDLYSNAILDRGRLIGLWEFDPEARQIVWVSFAGKPTGLVEAVSKMETFVRDELEDCRSFSLDSPESRKPKLAMLRGMS